MKKIFTIIIAFWSLNAFAQPKIETYLDKNIINFAQKNTIHIKVILKKKQEVYFPPFRGELIKNLPITKVKNDTTETKNNYIIQTNITFLTLLQDTTITIPAYPILLANRDTIYSDSLKLKINPYKIDKNTLTNLEKNINSDTPIFKVKPDTPITFNAFWKKYKKIYKNSEKPLIFKIKDILSPKCSFKEFWARHGLWILLLLVLILAFLIIRNIYKKYKNQNGKQIQKINVPPYVWAEKELKKLLDKQLLEKGQTKEFYFHLSRIIRQYIELRYNIDLLEHTTSEIIETLQSSHLLTDELFEKLKTILITSDLVKFAKYQPNAQTNNTNINFAFDIIKNTKPQEPAEAQNNQKNNEQINQK